MKNIGLIFNWLSALRRPGGKRRDRRFFVLMLAVLGVVGMGYLFRLMPGNGEVADTSLRTKPTNTTENLIASIEDRRDTEVPVPVEETVTEDVVNADSVRKHLKQASDLIRAKRPDDAIRELNRNRDEIKGAPQTYLVLGRALEAKGEYAAARDFYNEAITRAPYLADAYWGFATASESLNDLPSALGAMRSYLHTEPDSAPYRRRIAQARSAIWEWETTLGRGPWGPTKGVPPGFTAAELKRDGRGVGVKMPAQNTETSNGVSRAEIKSADKVKIYPR